LTRFLQVLTRPIPSAFYDGIKFTRNLGERAGTPIDQFLELAATTPPHWSIVRHLVNLTLIDQFEDVQAAVSSIGSGDNSHSVWG
jgi:hypothetical protein